MVRELSMTQVAHVGPYQAQLAHIPCWGRWGPWGGSGGVQSLKIGHFWTFLPDFPGLQNQVLGYFWVKWTLFDPHARFGEVSHIDFRSIAILSRPYPKRAFYSSIWRPKFMKKFSNKLSMKALAGWIYVLVDGIFKIQTRMDISASYLHSSYILLSKDLYEMETRPKQVRTLTIIKSLFQQFKTL